MSESSLYRYLHWQATRPRAKAGSETQVATVDAKAIARQESLIRRTLAHPDASRLASDEATVTDVIDQLEHEHGGGAELASTLAAAGLDRDELHQAVTMELHAGLLLDAVGSEVAISEQEVEAYYHDHPERMQRPEIRDAEHILVTLNEDFPENRRAEVEQRLLRLREKLAAGDIDFATLAEQHSECPTAMQGGRLGRVVPGKLYPELEAALFALEVDAVSEPVESPLGLHLLRCDAIEPARALSLGEAAQRIRQFLEERARKARIGEWLRHADPPH